MNILKTEKQEMVIGGLVEGSSIRSIERMTGVHRDTIMRLMVGVGNTCEKIMNTSMRNLTCKDIEVDEVWSFVGKKQRHVGPMVNPNMVGDFYTFIVLDSETKLIPTYKVGKRDLPTAQAFISDLSSRLSNRIQLSSDKLKAYVEAVETVFSADIDYGQIVKSYEAEPIGPGRYSPPKVISVLKEYITGNPDFNKICTSFVERQNLTVRMQMRRFTRLTNAFSKKLENLKTAVALHFTHYNFERIHGTLRMTPAMAAGVTKELWSIRDLIERAN
ncbi:MAG: IS1 family transposase [Deltaproteobacteria bacterium CG03_land_8_20_14_0_80_45_14]|nr:MAG: IS1 family transposase [Deltaproteobacteria bacterium CG03_land_8_20_14_0_80_45_14]